MSVTINPEALAFFTRAPEGPVGVLIAAKTETVLLAARANVGRIMARTGFPAEALVGSHLDVGEWGPQGHVGTEGSGSMARYLAAKENREHVWLTPAIKDAGFVEA